MRNIISKLMVIVIIMIFSINVNANSINEIEMNVYLDNGGNAIVEEVWNSSLTQGTEGYRTFSNLGKKTITDFNVTDDTGKLYENIERWNSNLTFDEKRYKSGINYINDGLELCWGISNYGDRKYTLKYKINNLVTQYTDNQGIYFNFLNLKQKVGKVKINIYADFFMSLNNTRIWSFGNNGTINFNNGKIIMEANNGLLSNHYIVIMTRFNEKMFETSDISTKSFDDIYDEAFKNVKKGQNNENVTNNKANIFIDKIMKIINNNKESGFVGNILNILIYIILAILMIIGCILLLILLPIIFLIYIPFPFSIIFSIIYGFFEIRTIKTLLGKHFHNRKVPNKYITKIRFKSDKKIPSYKEIAYYRDIPCDKDLYIMYWICYQYNIVDEVDLRKGIIGAIILKWIRDNNIIIRKTSKSYELVLNKEVVIEDDLERQLYNILIQASSNNMILEKKEFEKWSRYNYQSIRNWLDKILYIGEYHLTDKKYITDNYVLDNVKELAIQIKGFKRFLLEFSLISDRESIEVKIWEEYLIYAELLGIANKVRKDLKELYPNVNFDTINNVGFDYIDIIVTSCYNGMTIGYNDEYDRTHSSFSDHDYSGSDSFSGGGGDSFSSGGSSAGGSSGGGFR